MDFLERFNAVMEYQPVDQVPNWEAGVWAQTRENWLAEGLDRSLLHWDWFKGEANLDFDPREFIHYNPSMLPLSDEVVLEEDERTILFRDSIGRVRKALKEGTVSGTRMSMDTYISFPVRNMADWKELKKKYIPAAMERYEPNWTIFRLEGWKKRHHPLVFGENCTTLGLYWYMRELMGTEPLSYAFFDQPELIDDMLEFQADFLIECAKPVLEKISVEYVCFSEDLAMKTGPLISPFLYKKFIFPRYKRVIEFYKSHGVKYICVDTDGNPEAVLPMMLDAGVDAIWPLERASDMDPIRLRKKFGRSLRLWGGVDKRVLPYGPQAIEAHLKTMIPLIEEGGFIPTVDHTVQPDVSWQNFQFYMECKKKLLKGELKP